MRAGGYSVFIGTTATWITVLLIYESRRDQPTQSVSPAVLIEDLQPGEWTFEIESWRERKIDSNLQTRDLQW